MRAVVAERPGPPDVLAIADLDDPRPRPGQVAVAVEVAAITFIDTQLRAGTSPRPAGPFPMVPGNGVGGTVVAVGADDDGQWIGARVVTATGGSGGYASRALASVDDLHRVPEALDVQTAVALLADGRTAVGLAAATALVRGDTVVVTAAGGGVGSLLVQLAARAGARVVALAGDQGKLELASDLGADVTINYRDPTWDVALDASVPDGLDVVFDGVGGDVSAVLFERTRRSARYAVHGAASGRWPDIDAAAAVSRGVTIVPLHAVGATAAANFALVEEALDLAATGALRPTVGQTFPLARAADAHTAIEQRRTVGKTLLIV